jgi:hypothetical protein
VGCILFAPTKFAFLAASSSLSLQGMIVWLAVTSGGLAAMFRFVLRPSGSTGMRVTTIHFGIGTSCCFTKVAGDASNNQRETATKKAVVARNPGDVRWLSGQNKIPHNEHEKRRRYAE